MIDSVRNPAPVIYEPDMQDELITDADALGGRAFVERLNTVAAAAADAVCGPWDDPGPEPPDRREAWAGRGVGARRAAPDRAGSTRRGDHRRAAWCGTLTSMDKQTVEPRPDWRDRSRWPHPLDVEPGPTHWAKPTPDYAPAPDGRSS